MGSNTVAPVHALKYAMTLSPSCSVRINERPARRALPGTELSPTSIARMDVASKENKKLAYLLDLEHIRVVDLVTGINVATVNHDAKVSFVAPGAVGVPPRGVASFLLFFVMVFDAASLVRTLPCPALPCPALLCALHLLLLTAD